MLRVGILLLCAVFAIAARADVYRWTDQNGQVHFGERPPHDGAERIEVLSQPGRPPTVTPSESERRNRQRRMLESFEYKRERKAQQEAEAARRARERAVQCERLRRYWRRLNHPGPIYESDDQGGRRYLDDQERAAKKGRLRPIYREICGEQPG